MIDKLLGNSGVPVYIKLQASAILSVTYLGTLAYIGYDAVVHGGSIVGISPLATFIVGTGLSTAMQILNIHVTESVSSNATQKTQEVIASASSTPA